MNIREKGCLLHLGCETARAGTQSQRSQSSALLLVLPAAIRLVRGGGCHISGGFLFSPWPSGTDRAGPLGVGMGALGLVVYSKGYQHHKDNRLVMLAGWRMASPSPPHVPSLWGQYTGVARGTGSGFSQTQAKCWPCTHPTWVIEPLELLPSSAK